jgi:opacity protein-like surface antigen
VFSFYNCSDITPYLAVGLGAARINIRNAYSEQLEPAEPGINHFNTDVSETDWTFAAQFKLGLKYALCERWHIFAEYRYLFVDFNSYMFGSTKYTGHPTTSPWFVQFENINHNACVIGIQYDL